MSTTDRPTTPDDDLRALATLDPAGDRDPHAHQSPQAQALLRDILSTGASSETAPTAATVTELRPRSRRRWVWAAAAAAVLAVGLAVVPGFRGSGSAYADWTDVPAAPAADDVDEALASCRDSWSALAQDGAEWGLPDPETVQDTVLVLAEQRGQFTYTVISDGEWAMDCLVQTRSHWLWGGGGGGAGSMQSLAEAGAPAADGVSAIIAGGFGGSDVEGLVLMMYGRVGADVTAVVAHVPDVGDVAATVSDGFFAAWAPGMTEAGFDDGVGLTLHLADGTTVDLTPEQVDAAGGAIP